MVLVLVLIIILGCKNEGKNSIQIISNAWNPSKSSYLIDAKQDSTGRLKQRNASQIIRLIGEA